MPASSDLARVLEQTLNPLYAKEGISSLIYDLSNICLAETNLKNEARRDPDFLTDLLTLIAAPQVALPIRQAAALFFKNFVRQNWKVCTER
jgi:Importin-beta N-terminal domain